MGTGDHFEVEDGLVVVEVDGFDAVVREEAVDFGVVQLQVVYSSPYSGQEVLLGLSEVPQYDHAFFSGRV